jgi:hypothetical protein
MPAVADHQLDITRHLGAQGPDRVLIGINDAGQPAIWDRRHGEPHMRLSGATGKGKSVAANAIAAHDIHHRNIIVHLDPKPGGAGWLAPYAHCTVTKAGHARALTWVRTEMEARQQACAAHQLPDGSVGVPDIHGLPWHTPRLLLILEEMAATVGDMALLPGPGENSKQAAARVEAAAYDLALILTQGRSTGIHVVGINQYPTVEGTFGRQALGGAMAGQFGARLHLDAIDISLRSIFNKGDGLDPATLRVIRAGRRGRGAYLHLDPADGGRGRAVQVWQIDRTDLVNLARTTPPPDDTAYTTGRPPDFDTATAPKEFTP